MEKLTQELKKTQLNCNNHYKNYPTDNYSNYQNYLYKRVLYGLDSLPEEEVLNMCNNKRKRIVSVYNRTQVIINRFKQQITVVQSNFIINLLFPNSPLYSLFTEKTETDDSFKNKLSFKDLGISKDQLINVFITEGILPKNFLNLNEKPNELPRLKSF